MLKKILTALGIFATLSAVAISCAPTAPSSPATTFYSAPSNLPLDTTHPANTSAIALSCGCPFAITVTGYGGDTNIIHFSFNEPLDTMITTHQISASISSPYPAGPDTVTAWIGLYTANDSVSASNPGSPLYDTLRATAIY